MSSFQPIDFKSSWQKDEQRGEIRKSRNIILEQAKAKYEREERKKEEAKLRGEDTWMLPSISNRIDQEAEKLKKKKKKHKKEKKHKKHKKKHKGASDDSGSDSDQWIEKAPSSDSNVPVVKGPRLERDDWMTAPIDPLSSLPCVSRDELRAKRKDEKEKEEKQESTIEQLGQHARELNPYWKDGGTGLPEQQASHSKAAVSVTKGVTGDGGVGWWKKAYQRCVEQAEEEGLSLEQVAIDRYGSLEMLESMVAKAEDTQRQKEEEESMWKQAESRHSGRSRGRGERRGGMRSRSRSRSMSRERNSRGRDSRTRRSRSRSKERKRLRSQSRDRDSSDRRRSRSRDRDRRDRRSRSRDRDRKDRRSRSRDRDRRERRSRSRDRRMAHSTNSKISRRKPLFKKPGDSSDSDTSDRGHSASLRGKQTSGDSHPAWKKRGFVRPKEHEEDADEVKRTPKREPSPGRDVEIEKKRRTLDQPRPGTSAPRWKKPGLSEQKPSSSRARSPASCDSSSSSESESESEDEPPPKKPVRVLTQEEMNKLGSQLVRAEILGNQAEAARIKAELEAARKAQAESESMAAPSSGGREPRAESKAGQEDDNVVVLTRTDRHGMVRPLPSAKQHAEPHGGRRKKKAVTTHSKGERERYFDDDDQHDLKTMVEREKLGTAEDQNAMFSRLAGKSFDKTDEEWQVDDVFLSRAAKKQASGREEERQKSLAVKEHRKMATSLGKCPFCLDNVPKHLIVAMGIKVYMCLPNHRSLTEGHCLIVPMQHSPQGTVLDEDVWEEIQVFRKGLTRMFEDREDDCVFMETSMNLKKQPHMVVECIPLPREVGDLAPIYFKKAIQDSETEWAQNKKLVELKGRDVRKAVPKGFPYFSVDFGLQSGFAHVIEDEMTFPRYFGREIVGGMLDAEPQLWRKPAKEDFERQRTKVLQFAEWWKGYDWTQDIHKEEDD